METQDLEFRLKEALDRIWRLEHLLLYETKQKRQHPDIEALKDKMIFIHESSRLSTI